MLAHWALRTAFRSRLRPVRLDSSSGCATRRLLLVSHHSLHQSFTPRSVLWYRQDGTPRSKREGVIYVTLAILLWLPCHRAYDIAFQNELTQSLIHFRRINSHSNHDLSQVADVVEYIFKLIQIDSHLYGKEHREVAAVVCEAVLEAFPEITAIIRAQLKELRNVTANDDVNQDIFETALAAEKTIYEVADALYEGLLRMTGIPYLKPERQKLDATDVHRVIG